MAAVNNAEPAVHQAFKEFKWYNSLSLPIEIQCGVARLEIPSDIPVTSSFVPNNIYISAYIICNQMAVHETPVSTQFSHIDATNNALVWDYVLTFPVKMRDLSIDSLLVFTAWTADGKPFGGTNMKFFDDRECLKRGKQKLMFYFNTRGDANVISHQNLTPGDFYSDYEKWDYKFKMEKTLEKYKMGVSASAGVMRDSSHNWLDRILLERIYTSLENPEVTASDGDMLASLLDQAGWGRPLEEIDLDTFCFLIIEMPSLPHEVLHDEKQYPTVSPHVPPTTFTDIIGLIGPSIVEMDDTTVEFSLVGRPFNATSLTIVADWDMDAVRTLIWLHCDTSSSVLYFVIIRTLT